MGLEIADEFRPITLIRTMPQPPPQPLSQSSMNLGRIKFSDLNVERPEVLVNFVEEEEECDQCCTPKSSSQLMNNNILICPPAPRKPRPPAKRRNGPPPKFFHVPNDLASLFVPISNSSKKIRAS
ncbi:cyclin-dependent protein kinase inhibitor SMR6-like [Telopea speciosissima]|uniref:cyclin-dependent protein kinase inhibitor SMR6-like n=1 Tax=Telopea speciosissima TaxID=54955 RepID=UPI001CC709BF|nr:cyclin-dependent protein kinase inhibitor SMR6-like [Telopea speciosissima]